MGIIHGLPMKTGCHHVYIYALENRRTTKSERQNRREGEGPHV